MELRDLPVLPLVGYRGNTCSGCGAAPRTRVVDGVERPEGFVDLGVWIEQEGAFALCDTCCAHLARHIGFLAPEQVEELTAELAETLDRVQVQIAEIAELRAVVAAQGVVIAHRHGELEPAVPMSDTDVVNGHGAEIRPADEGLRALA